MSTQRERLIETIRAWWRNGPSGPEELADAILKALPEPPVYKVYEVGDLIAAAGHTQPLKVIAVDTNGDVWAESLVTGRGHWLPVDEICHYRYAVPVTEPG